MNRLHTFCGGYIIDCTQQVQYIMVRGHRTNTSWPARRKNYVLYMEKNDDSILGALAKHWSAGNKHIVILCWSQYIKLLESQTPQFLSLCQRSVQTETRRKKIHFKNCLSWFIATYAWTRHLVFLIICQLDWNWQVHPKLKFANIISWCKQLQTYNAENKQKHRIQQHIQQYDMSLNLHAYFQIIT